ncbi:CRISPR-associated helicase Cas3' [Asticcacaulis sp. EMRT-3]|uniref:CRISPR-associated helicase Cas3' n=1 Tax=Asticcacaulis sp. EMRT-3 TaxID=3040349 RepID=UPI0024AEEBB8|nr:CRISPR-associated helicase Cas3' [Asticcacaulis sp. EMRT-3]MDI7775763.1 CRISPR-associated helicase Cas3' [Asticcacaulis sp. EMRT-3]
MRFITNYWGKARPPEGINGPAWHPLAYHSLDVAAVLSAVLDLRPCLLQTVSARTGLSEADTRQWMLLVAALHDLGKFAENFQTKVPELAETLGHAPQSKWGPWGTDGHGDVGHALWQKDYRSACPADFNQWLHAAVSHHGVPASDNVPLNNVISDPARTDAGTYVEAVFSLLGKPADQRPRASAQAEIWRVAGLVILADWIGSNAEDRWFPYEKPDYLTLEAYWPVALEKGRKAVSLAALAEAEAATHFNLAHLFDTPVTASPLQDWAAAQNPENGPNLYIIEDLTGSGKTEAALLLAHRLMRAGAAEGLYWALPSMATANGLYDRLEKTYRRLFEGESEPSLILAHSARDLHMGFQASIRGGRYAPTAQADDLSAEASCAAFLAEDRKRTFLAQVGIGTIDQALLAALPVRHNALRLAALSRRVLVIDEVHAFDGYMTAGIESLIRFQAALGGSVIMLSATLTLAQRQKFIRIFGGKPLTDPSAAFPLISHVDPQKQVHETAAPAHRGTRRDLKTVRYDTSESVMQALLDKAEAGACCLYIRNTVAEATEAYEWLSRKAGPKIGLHLFHARFCLQDRIRREQAVLKQLGKHSTPDTRKGQIIVATQVVEQSLDLDADYMATDLCPMDLLIQRAGRLHRHDRPDRAEPELWVVSRPAVPDAGEDWYGGLFSKGQYVYEDHGQLWRTQRILEQTGGLNCLSASVRDLIEPVFDRDGDCPEGLRTSSDQARARNDADRAVSKLNFIHCKDANTPPAGFIHDAKWAPDTKTPTRLGEASITVRLARWANGALTPWAEADRAPLSWRLSELSLRAARFAEAVYPDEACRAAVAAVQAGWPQRYDPPPVLALIPSDTPGLWQGQIKDHRDRVVSVRYSMEQGLVIEN